MAVVYIVKDFYKSLFVERKGDLICTQSLPNKRHGRKTTLRIAHVIHFIRIKRVRSVTFRSCLLCRLCSYQLLKRETEGGKKD